MSHVAGYLAHIMNDCAGWGAGQVADYIPELAAADPDRYGLSMCVHDGHIYSLGDSDVEFTIQSVSKPLTYALAMSRLGHGRLDEKVGVEPSGDAFNEVSVDERCRPRNPMINAGAILTSSLLLPPVREVAASTVRRVFDELLDFYSMCAGRRLRMDENVYRSEAATGSRNRAIVYMLDSFGVVDTDPEAALDLYYRQCSVLVNTDDLAIIGATIAGGGLNPRTGRQVFNQEVAQRLLSVMTTCGMYDGAGDWVTSVGLPAKSGVAGAVLAALPGQLGIGVYSPRLDEHGNSVRGVQTCRHLSSDLGLHMFNVTRESRVTIRGIYDVVDVEVGAEWDERQRRHLRAVRDRIRVYELQGDLTFAGTESAMRRIEADLDEFDVAIVDISRIGVIDPVARTMLLSMRHTLTERGQLAMLVDPDRVVAASVARHRADSVAPDLGAPEELRGFDPSLPHVHASMAFAVDDAERFQVRDVPALDGTR